MCIYIYIMCVYIYIYIYIQHITYYYSHNMVMTKSTITPTLISNSNANNSTRNGTHNSINSYNHTNNLICSTVLIDIMTMIIIMKLLIQSSCSLVLVTQNAQEPSTPPPPPPNIVGLSGRVWPATILPPYPGFLVRKVIDVRGAGFYEGLQSLGFPQSDGFGPGQRMRKARFAGIHHWPARREYVLAARSRQMFVAIDPSDCLQHEAP